MTTGTLRGKPLGDALSCWRTNCDIDGFAKTRESRKIADFWGKGEATKQVTFLHSKNGTSVVCADAQASIFACGILLKDKRKGGGNVNVNYI